MRLLDSINESNGPLRVTNDRLKRTFELPGASLFKSEIAEAPLKYILDEAATRMCAEAALINSQVITTSLDLVRLPAETVWIEWLQGPRTDVLRQRSEEPDHLRPDEGPRRAGLLVLADKSGQSGVVRLFSGGDDSADLHPLSMKFDMRSPASVPAKPEKLEEFTVSRPDFPALNQVLLRFTFVIDEKWKEYYASASASLAVYNDTIMTLASQVWFDWPFMLSLLLLLQTRSPMRQRQTDFSKLNRARLAKRKTPLLDHVEITLSLTDQSSSNSSTEHPNAKVAKRLHHVKGHLVRRADKVFWRSAHLRGDIKVGSITSKILRVKG